METSSTWHPSRRSIVIASILWLVGSLVALVYGPVASANLSVTVMAAVIVPAATAIVAFLLYMVCVDTTDDAEPAERKLNL